MTAVLRVAQVLWEHKRQSYPGYPEWDRIMVGAEPVFGAPHQIGDMRTILDQARVLLEARLLAEDPPARVPVQERMAAEGASPPHPDTMIGRR